VNQGARRNTRRAPAAGLVKQADPRWMTPAVGPGLGSCSSVAGRPFPLATLEEAPALNGLGRRVFASAVAF
jgi:hypothetical protein